MKVKEVSPLPSRNHVTANRKICSIHEKKKKTNKRHLSRLPEGEKEINATPEARQHYFNIFPPKKRRQSRKEITHRKKNTKRLLHRKGVKKIEKKKSQVK